MRKWHELPLPPGVPKFTHRTARAPVLDTRAIDQAGKSGFQTAMRRWIRFPPEGVLWQRKGYWEFRQVPSEGFEIHRV